MLLRSMYVIRYMKLMRTRTSQRVLVGLDAAISSVAAFGEADVRVVSSILSLGDRLGGPGFSPDIRAGSSLVALAPEASGPKGLCMRHWLSDLKVGPPSS